ncbi:MAG: ABC-2 transporter permease [Candidatus Spyradocola sp.]|jgi:ABC-2 type transport system permease protein
MKSLILKDLFNIAHNAKTMAVILLLFAAIFIPTSGAEGYLFISAILCSMMIVTTFAFDDACNWPRYALAMPLSRRDLVRGKFAVLAIFCTVGTGLGLLLGTAGGLLARKIAPGDLPSLLFLALPAWGFAMLLGGLSIPLVFRFGSERGRILLILSFLVPAGLFLGAYRLLLLLGLELTGQAVLALLGLLPLFALLFCLLMEQVSVRIFSCREV